MRLKEENGNELTMHWVKEAEYRGMCHGQIVMGQDIKRNDFKESKQGAICKTQHMEQS